jgi:hypothetical protein
MPKGPQGTMTYEIEFFRLTQAPEGWVVMRRVSHECDALKAAESYGLSHVGADNSPEQTDGFRIYLDGVSQKTVFVRPGKQDA